MIYDSSAISPEQRLRTLEDVAASRGLPIQPITKVRELERVAASRGLLTYPRFEDFVRARNPSLLDYEHIPKILDVAQRVIDLQLLRVIVLQPTQSFKSECWSRLLPAYYLLKYPARTVALTSYGADLAWELSSDARDYYAASGGQFRDGSPKGASRNWRTARTIGGTRGGMWATGIGGPGLGRGYHLGIVDDPLSTTQIRSLAHRKKFERWWGATWLRGARPGRTPIVVLMQRLAMEDPIEFLLTKEETRAAENWHILALDEIKSDEPFGRWKGPRGFPKTCTVEPDERKPGEILYPSWRTAAEVARIHRVTPATEVSAQRQQRPMQPTGDFWPLKAFEGRVYDTLPRVAYNGGWDWDTAYTKEENNSATAGIRSFRGPGDKDSFPIYIEDVQWDWLETPALVKLLKALQGPHYVEQKASGKSVVQFLKTYGVVAEEVKVLGDKLARASAVQPAVTTGRVFIRKAVFDLLLYGEHQGLLRVTAESLQLSGEGLDLNDAFVQCLWRHLDIATSNKRRARFG